MTGAVRRRVGVLISGRGSNMAALVAAARDPRFPAEIVLVLANLPGAPGLADADAAGIAARCIDHRPFGRDRAAHEAEIVAALDAAEVDVVCLAGWMRLLTSFLVQRYEGRMLNIHPSLLPAFPGLHTHARALAAGVKLHGCTVHLVTEEMDRGPILAQVAVPVLPGDTPDRLAARVLAQEHLIYPIALAGLAARLDLPVPPAGAALSNPLSAMGLASLPPAPHRTNHPRLLRDKPMSETHTAAPVASGSAPLTEEAFLADRQQFWGSFTGLMTGAVITAVVVLLLMLIFLV